MDTIDKHLRSLEVLGQNIEQDVFISMIKSKLPKDILLQMELKKDPDTEWTVESLRKCLLCYILWLGSERSKIRNRNSFSGSSRNQQGRRYDKTEATASSNFGSVHSAEALVVTSKGKGYNSDKCRYCQNHHWSDECTKFKTVEERKKQLKDSWYKWLKVGHKSRDCKSSKVCVHCGTSNDHHRSLCPKKIPKRIQSEHVQLAEEANINNSIAYDQTEEFRRVSAYANCYG